MAFFSKAVSLLRQTASKHINQDIAASKPSIFQVIRCMSSSKVFIGGLSYSTDDTSLREAFSKYGDVAEARVIQDRETGRSRGFGFVTYASAEAASAAIQALDGQELHGRSVRVNYANDRARGYGGGGAGFGNSGGRFGGYGGGGSGYGGQDSFGGYAARGGGGDSYGSGGNYPSGGYNASGGSLNYETNASAGDSFASSEHDKNTGLYGGGDQFGSNNSSNMTGTDPVDGDFRDDDDEPGDYANRKA